MRCMAIKTTSFRFDEDTVKLLAALCTDMGGISQSDVVRMALRDMAKARGVVEPTKVKR